MWSDARLRRHLLGGAADDTPLWNGGQRIGDSRAARGATETARPGTRPGNFAQTFNADPENGTLSFELALLPAANGRRPRFHFREVRRRPQ